MFLYENSFIANMWDFFDKNGNKITEQALRDYCFKIIYPTPKRKTKPKSKAIAKKKPKKQAKVKKNK